MSRVNGVSDMIFNSSTQKPDTRNVEGYPAYTRSLEEQYVQSLLTNTIGGSYYTSRERDFEQATGLHQAMLQKDPKFMAGALGFARSAGYMRLQPIIGLAHLSSKHPELMDSTYHNVVKIPDDLFEFKTILNAMGRGEGGRAIKRNDSKFMNNVSEYWAIKYNGRGRGYNLTDILRTSHPAPINEKQQAIFGYLTEKPYDAHQVPQISSYVALRSAKNDKDICSIISEGKLPHEVVTGVLSHMSPTVWKALVPQLPKMALLRHLNTIDRNGLLADADVRNIIEHKMMDAKGMILPFQYMKAYEAMTNVWARGIIGKALENSFNAIPDIHGRTAIFLDISGSMSGSFVKTASIFALALFKKTGGEAIFNRFNTRCVPVNPSMTAGILNQAEEIARSYGGGTDTGVCVKDIHDRKEKVDNIICITDEAQNTGSPFYARLRHYRRKINPNTRAFIIDVSSYQGGMVPQEDALTNYIYGWSDNVLKYIPLVTQGFGGMVDDIRQNWVK